MPIVVPMRAQARGQPAPAPPPDPSYALMAASQMHEAGRLIKETAPPIDTSGNYGAVSKLLGYTDPPIHAVDDKHYPNATDAKIGSGVDQTYGDKVAPYLQPGSKAHKLGVDQAIAEDSSEEGIAYKTAKSVATTPEDRTNILQNWQAAQKSPISALGFDPRVTVHSPDEGRKLSLAGSYNPSNDTLWYHEAHQDAVVHESIHRGIQLLRKEDNLPDVAKDFIKNHTNGEEYLVRAFKLKYFGDIEKSPDADEGNKQVESARWFMTTGSTPGPQFRESMDAIEKAAAEQIAKHKPKGPR